MVLSTILFILSLNVSSYNQAIAQDPAPTEDKPEATQAPEAPTEDKPEATQAPATPTEDKPEATQAPATPTEDKPEAAQAPATPTEDKPEATQAPATPTEDKPEATQAPATPTEDKPEAAQTQPVAAQEPQQDDVSITMPFTIEHPRLEDRYTIIITSLNQDDSKLSILVVPENNTKEPLPTVALRAGLSGSYSLKTEQGIHTISITSPEGDKIFYFEIDQKTQTEILPFKEGQLIKKGTIIAKTTGRPFYLSLIYNGEPLTMCLSKASLPKTNINLRNFTQEEACSSN